MSLQLKAIRLFRPCSVKNLGRYISIRTGLSFREKLLIFTMALVLLVGGMMGLLIRFIVFPYLISEMESRGLAVGNRLSETARASILVGDRVHLTALSFDEKQLEKMIAYIIIEDMEKRPLAHTFLDREPPAAPVAGRELTIPVHEGLYTIGLVRVGLDEQFINSVIRKLNIFHLLFSGIILLAGFAFGVYLSRFITRPIGKLTVLAREIGAGNLNARIDLGRPDPCWRLLECNSKKCPAYENEASMCWLIDNTLCADGLEKKFPQKLKNCRLCAVYHQTADEIVHLAETFNHMAERIKMSEQKLRGSEERYRLLFNSDPHPVFVISPDGYSIVDVNDRALERFGFARDRLIGVPFPELGFSNSDQITKAFHDLDGRDGKCSLVPRIRFCTAAGEVFWVSIYSCSYNHMGEHQIIATTSEITEIIETEAKLIQTAKLATLGEMAAGVAHELNQPLNTIKLGTEFLLKVMEQGHSVSKEDLKEVAEDFGKEVDRASAIINHLRQFGRKSEIEKHMVDINEPLRGVFTILGQQLKANGIHVRLELDEDLPHVLADNNRLEQVFMNLIVNSRDAVLARSLTMPGSPKAISIRSYNKDGNISVSVSDTGIGIAPAVQSRIFEPFFTTKEVGKGTGLGLSISYGIIRDFEGNISFQTVENAGTTFTVTLPPATREKSNA
jgi:PAS domain S-box-containing protein